MAFCHRFHYDAGMAPEERYDRLVRALREAVRARGHGSVTRVAGALGTHRGFLADAERRKNLSLLDLLRVLDVIGQSPAGFIGAALGEEGGDLDRLLAELESAPAVRSEVLRKAEERWRSAKR